MKILTTLDSFLRLCQLQQSWGVHLASFGNDHYDFHEIEQACPKLPRSAQVELYVGDELTVFFDTEGEAHDFFDTVVGDDGPTHLNSYSGPVRVYAAIANPSGAIQKENT